MRQSKQFMQFFATDMQNIAGKVQIIDEKKSLCYNTIIKNTNDCTNGSAAVGAQRMRKRMHNRISDKNK